MYAPDTTLDMSSPEEAMKTQLFKFAMKGKWEEVVKIYEQKPEAHSAKITWSGDTTLHVAVSNCKEDIVKRLVEAINESPAQGDRRDALAVKNDSGNTALHLAASMGNVKMCEHIARDDPSLVGVFNLEGETPLFLTALRGHKGAFLCLYQTCGPHQGKDYCQRYVDGETVLHCAIAGEYFDLAFQIIHLYQDLANTANNRGFKPLHILASIPTAFKSGSNLRLWKSIIYHCIFVDNLKTTEPSSKIVEDQKDPTHPGYYQKSIKFLRNLRNETSKRCLKQSNTSDTKIPVEFAANEGDKGQQLKDPSHPGYYQKNIKFLRDLWNETLKRCLKQSNTSDTKIPVQFAPDEGDKGKKSTPQTEEHHNIFIDFVKLVYVSMMIVLGLGSMAIIKIKEQKEKHKWSVQIMNELLDFTYMYEYVYTGANPQAPHLKDEETKPYKITVGGGVKFSGDAENISTTIDENINNGSVDASKSTDKHKNDAEMEKTETAILIAAKNGVIEMVEEILERYPVAVHDMNADKKNIVLLAAEHRQPHLYRLFQKKNNPNDIMFRKLDKHDNSVLHLAATLQGYKPWLISGAAFQMQWEVKWYEFVKDSMTPYYLPPHNKDKKTPEELFSETHENLVKASSKWLTHTSQSCSVVGALIATVAFASSTTVPGGNIEESGRPTLENQPAFKVFAVSSLIALCFSVTSVVMFLAILTSRFQEFDFGKDLPRKLLIGLTSLFVSIASMLVSFCTGHFFVLGDKLQYAAFPVYVITCLPASIFAVSQFPLYFDLLWATYSKIPQRSYHTVALKL